MTGNSVRSAGHYTHKAPSTLATCRSNRQLVNATVCLLLRHVANVDGAVSELQH